MPPALTAREILQKLGRLGKETQFLDEFGSMVQDHDHFRLLLMKCDPAQRATMYEQLRSRLQFRPKPLEQYIAEAKEIAEREKLPTWDPETQTLTPYTPGEVRTMAGAVLWRSSKRNKQAKALRDAATRVLAQQYDIENARQRLTTTCAKCTAEAHFYGVTRLDALLKARRAGWRYQKSEVDGEGMELCPKCAPETVN